ncbi:UvrD-helicase domain-containing protein [Chitinophaga sancti]|uniref:DNA 3'-5' helicase II n=1 Tax=Chitinophaga sancti TaxID=1004 RepID=A0A1K1SSS8_9BACT|nr:UvrD-helicase domain-containing protein [Chitinophaga sancti]WQD65417.1 AAA family ATPase [Chitinophaga sancti]WQG88960.1 AAA family ATPase [Chitinophaga sancti]SFW87342.1 DNA helicase-2 / ATP-dependent DNA helicase PcrA [Chitinophaga sancti]
MSIMENKSNEMDAWVDNAISDYITPGQYKSFFLFAGAGSGKTTTLINVLEYFKITHKDKFLLRRKKIAVITYTNAAVDEITRRLKFDSIFQISTIHSFSWDLIKPFTEDIRKWVRENLNEEIADLEQEQSKSKNPQNKTSIDRARRIEAKTKRLVELNDIVKFTYNPNGDNVHKDSLDHTEVLAMTAYFISNKILMRQLVATKYPILLIDESQDTKKELIDAIFEMQQAMPEHICVGLFGDTMQRIYLDGKENLQNAIPMNWQTPHKTLNHRSHKRIVDLINNIRKNVDNKSQLSREEKDGGTVRLFICNRNSEKFELEKIIVGRMAEITKDQLWNDDKDVPGNSNVKTLILEHHMAARRMGFFDFFEALHEIPRYHTGLLNGSLPGVSIFTKVILPLLHAYRCNDKYELTKILKKNSPLLDSKLLKQSEDQIKNLKICKEAVDALLQLWSERRDPTILDVLENILGSGLFIIPESYYPIIARPKNDDKNIEKNESDKEFVSSNEELLAWENALSQPFSQIERYNDYLSENSKFGTHQGVKGLEFPRVMVIIDDEEARGFLFSYDKLFGAKEMSATDLKNKEAGKDTGIDRTNRLFYVACSRACDGLAIVCYTDNPGAVKKSALTYNWFLESEIEIM